jgi:hypothetical protein
MANTTNNPDRSPHPPRSPNTITIWQQNVNRSHTCQHTLISSAALTRKGIDIVALQEPAINNFGTTIASREWIPVYPSTHNTDPHKTRSLLLIRSNLLTDQWKQIDIPLGDVTIINISGNWGDMTVYNIYNDCEKNDTIHQLEAFSQACANSSNRTNANNKGIKSILWLGDFNRHHPHWDDPANTILFTRSAIRDAEILITAVAELSVTFLLDVCPTWT